jgi:hypothetical protein
MKTNTININNFEIIEYNSNIFVIKNFLDKDFCNKIINLMDDSNYFKPNMYKNNVECFEVIYNDNEYIINLLNDKILDIFKIFSELLNITITDVTRIQLRKVFGETRLHTDSAVIDETKHPYNNTILKTVRALTLVGVLNDNYEGGIYNFPKQEFSIKLETGSIILFPPYWTHPHSVSKITIKSNESKYRYIFSCWAMDDFLVNRKEDIDIKNIILIK